MIAFEPAYHSALVRRLLNYLPAAELLRLGRDDPELVWRTAEEYAGDPACGFLEFAVCTGKPTHAGVDYRDALMRFARWPPERVRLCFDVTDGNFAELFSEAPARVATRCDRLRRRLSRHKRFKLLAPGTELAISCPAAAWKSHTGLEPSDYILPSGELQCRPRSVDGQIDFDGWIVGTIPFGLKYGRVTPGALRLLCRNGQVVDLSGSNRSLCRDLQAALASVPGLGCASEIGFGQSKAVVKAAVGHEVGCLWHERHFGLHIGFGAGLDEKAGMRKTHHHLDLVFASGRVVDNKRRTVLAW